MAQGTLALHVCHSLVPTQCDVAIIDNLSTGFETNIQHGSLHQIDLNEWDNVNKFIAEYKPDAIIHFAGSIVVPESVKNP